MKIKKIWKSAFLLALIPGSLLSSVALISCGSKAKPPAKATWSEFKVNAKAEKEINIIKNATPLVWADATANQLVRSSFVPDEANKIINITIVRTIDATNISNANFQIIFTTKKYDVKNWICSNKPAIDSTWAQFLAAVQVANPADFLAAAKKSPNYKTKFIWGGDTSQQTWQADDKAEFDVYGGLVTSGQEIPDPAGVNLMHGNPTDAAAIDKTAATVTVVISKTNRAGLFDADPIKIVYKYSGAKFDIAKGIFSKTMQLQSNKKYLAVIDVQKYINNIVAANPNNANWTIFAKNYWSSDADKTHSITIDSWMTTKLGKDYATSGGWAFHMNGDYAPDNSIKDANGKEIGLQYFIPVQFTKNSDATTTRIFDITNDFIYAYPNGDPNSNPKTNWIANTPFDFSWNCVETTKH